MSLSVPHQTCAGLLSRKLRWGLTLRGWVCLLGFAAATAVCAVLAIHPFLAVDKPLRAEILVIEGWIPEYAVRQCGKQIEAGVYQRVVTVGGPVSSVAPPAADDDTHAYVAARILQRMGLKPGSVEMVPTPTIGRDRTYNSALTLRRWLEKNNLSPRTINVVTLGVHARRSRLLFEKAMGDDITVGIISITNEEYDPNRWWRYSEGVKEILSEGAAYIYARFLFHP